ncbi:MAG: hypothetical protein AAF840_12635 [Bacteroidota bacterium]
MRPIFLLTLFMLVLTGCREEGLSSSTTITGTIPPPQVITAQITTVVVNQSGSPLSDATITGLQSPAQENPDGSLRIDAGSLSSEGTMVTVSSPGHWPERRLIMPAGDGQFVERFVLEEKVKAGDLNPADGGRISLAENFSVTLSPNSIVRTESGAPYDGPVDIYINHDAPEDPEEMLNSPGNALAQLADGSLANLESFGMMDIALEAPDGTPLELDPSTPAEVRMPLKNTTTPTAPDEVGFWQLDANGFWQPAGTAVKGDDCYIVFVVVSGGYNCDVPRPAAQLCGRLVDASGFPLSHTAFSINLAGGFSCWNALTDCNGEFCAWVAADSDLEVIVLDPCLGTEVSLPIAPITVSNRFEGGDLTVDLTVSAFLANVTDCAGSGLPALAQTEIWANGYGGANGKYVSFQTDGGAFVSVADCAGDDVLIQAFTRDYRAASPVFRRSANDATPQTLVVCGELDADEYFALVIDGVPIPITELAPIYWPDNGDFNWLVRAAGVFEGEEYSLLLNFSDPVVGDYAADNAAAAIYRLTPGQAYGEGRVYVDPTQALILTGLSVSNDGDIFEGRLQGTMNLQNDAAQTVEAVNLPVVATFRIKL